MDELQELMNNLDLENNSYFYHITGKGFGRQIMEEGLSMSDKNLFSTTIELPQELINNPEEYCKGELEESLVKRQEMVIIVCEKGEEKYLVVPNNNASSNWTQDESADYIIDSENILGYVDLDTLTVNYNPECLYIGYSR